MSSRMVLNETKNADAYAIFGELIVHWASGDGWKERPKTVKDLRDKLAAKNVELGFDPPNKPIPDDSEIAYSHLMTNSLHLIVPPYEDVSPAATGKGKYEKLPKYYDQAFENKKKSDKVDIEKFKLSRIGDYCCSKCG